MVAGITSPRLKVSGLALANTWTLDFASCLINTITKCASSSGYERDDACTASTLYIFHY